MKTKKQTPFLDIDKEVILVGDLIRAISLKKGEKPKREKPMKVCFGEYKAGKDDWNMDYIVYGFYIEFHDGGVYSLTQEGKGYSIAAMNCRIVKK